jgi:urease accessory protein
MRSDSECLGGSRLIQERKDYQAPSHWQASINLGFTRCGEKTLLSERLHHGPLRVQRPFYPEGGLCHVYLLHPPGGVVAGDCLTIQVQAESDTESLLTTPGAGKFYRSESREAKQQVDIFLKEGAVLEWLPQETILYQGSRVTSSVHVSLAENARFIGWEITVLGRPAAREGFEQGNAYLNWKIVRCGQPLLVEKMHLDAQSLQANWGLNQRPVCGNLFIVGAGSKQLEQIREFVANEPGRGVTLIDDVLICRGYDYTVAPVRRFFETVRDLLREDIIGYKPHYPRIWAT